MEQLNRVEVRGTVGSIYIKEFRNTRCVNFSVATNGPSQTRVLTGRDASPGGIFKPRGE